ncbi:FAD:protein FMN transferase [Pseudomonas sp. BBP2017]|uniref:FAD:protein FMN transferase n=1 Tax=Pseudomonas sp. BBP2017 TaxID=2109731 RepID=UPI000D13AE7B|nr:FAD:protein FMN transferase [Pseudomonas sp. BBP2017]PSS58445.1 thiamine biosynthesis protein ApbE [Pseudomonas sp. BBP2017]
MSTEQLRYNLSGATMGTRFSAVLQAPAGLDTAAIGAALQAAVDSVDRQMSTWNPDSDLMRLNAAPCGQLLAVPDELLWVLVSALQVSVASGGAFEIAVGELVKAYGFGPQPSSGRTPGRPVRASEALEIDPALKRVRKHAPLTLDLNGIAKGFAVDEMARCLEAHGIDAYLVGIDGEMRARGVKADGSDWKVALERPVRGRREVLGALDLSDIAIATSGDYRHWRERDAKTYSHTMDPAAGEPLQSNLASVSVLCTSCMYADAWATALMVLGLERGRALAERQGLGAIFVLREGDELREVAVGL